LIPFRSQNETSICDAKIMNSFGDFFSKFEEGRFLVNSIFKNILNDLEKKFFSKIGMLHI
jgi:hypothetical protein